MPGFPREARLRRPPEFQAVLKKGRRIGDRLLTAAVLSRDGDAGARLGLAISARAVPGAVGRNRIKRTVRESFRAARPTLPSADFVIQARAAAAKAPAAALRHTLDRFWSRAAETCKAS